MSAATILIYVGVFFVIAITSLFIVGAVIGLARLAKDALPVARRAPAPASAPQPAAPRALPRKAATVDGGFAAEPAYAGD